MKKNATIHKPLNKKKNTAVSALYDSPDKLRLKSIEKFGRKKMIILEIQWADIASPIPLSVNISAEYTHVRAPIVSENTMMYIHITDIVM